MNKRGGGKPIGSYSWNYNVVSKLLASRKKIHRIMESSIEKPKIGPDFGGQSSEGKYLEAYKRYSQGSFMEGLKESGVNLKRWFQEHELFFISALYGLVNWKEPIQNYDLDLENQEIYREWRSNQTITRALIHFLSNAQENIDCVINCCAHYKYSQLIDWKQLRKFEVMHLMAKGDSMPSQIRWASGYLAGANPEILVNMIKDENKIYRNPNAIIMLARELPVMYEEVKEKEFKKVPVEMLKNNNVAVACLRDEQYESFLNYARNHGWDEFLKFKKLVSLNQEILNELDKAGFKILVIHVDAPHGVVNKSYKLSGKRFEDLTPKDWQVIKITNNRYSDIRFELNTKIKIREHNYQDEFGTY